MKINILLLSFLVSYQFISAQCVADAGQDIHRCSSDTSVQLGGDPTAIGGTPPYIYEWSIDPIPFIPPTFPFLYASNMLDDTSIANPSFIYAGSLMDDSIPFFLRITDSIGCISYDTIILTTSFFGIHLAYWTYNIYLGDSVYLNEGTNVGCINDPQCKYLWSPTHGLSDSTLPSGFWAKPDSNIAYTPTATDSKGCSKTVGVTYYISVRPVGIQNLNSTAALRIFPNPTDNIINVETDNNVQIQKIRLLDLKGMEINIANVGNQIDLRNISGGMYILEIQTNNMTVRRQIMKK